MTRKLHTVVVAERDLARLMAERDNALAELEAYRATEHSTDRDLVAYIRSLIIERNAARAERDRFSAEFREQIQIEHAEIQRLRRENQRVLRALSHS